MLMFFVLALAWLALAVLGWSWFAMAARADRERSQQLLRRSPPPYSQPHA
jgi:hypothetical protein